MGGPEDFFGVMYYIGKINTGVPPGLGVPPIFFCFGWGLGGGGSINHCHWTEEDI